MKVVIEGVAPHIDGDYEFDLGSFSNRELHQIKTASGVRPAELAEAFVMSDAAFACAVGTIVCQRAGKRINEEIFMDAAGGSIYFVFGEEPADEEDPTVPAKAGSSSKRSGRSSKKSSGSPAADPSRSGEQT